MSLPIPNLDDKSFDDLLNEARTLIPVYNKEWTNHNPSDPGLTLLELFAWLTEMTIYRLNQVPDNNYRQFLKLIGVDAVPAGDLDAQIREGLAGLARQTRAITSQDFENLALECMEQLQSGLAGRAICVNNRDLEHYLKNSPEKRGHVTVLIIPQRNGSTLYQNDGVANDLLKQKVKEYLDQRRLITTRVHVIAPQYLDVKIDITISIKANTVEKAVIAAAQNGTAAYFDHVTGGPDGNGWPLGRDVYRSELYEVLEGIDGIDHVDKMLLDNQETLEIALAESQLPKPIIHIEKK